MESWRTVLVGLCATHGQRYFRAASAIVRERTDAEDACQQAFLKAWQSGLRVGIPDSPQAWLMRLTINEALTIYRRRRSAAALRLRASTGRSSGGDDGASRAEVDTRERLVTALESLPESTRYVIVLRVVEGLSGNDAAELLDCSPAEVSRRLHSGMEALRRVLSGTTGETAAFTKVLSS
jgi:RNA polymerase sigma-70 factor (ECF subfamily)